MNLTLNDLDAGVAFCRGVQLALLNRLYDLLQDAVAV